MFKRDKNGEGISQQTRMIRSQAAAGAGCRRPGQHFENNIKFLEGGFDPRTAHLEKGPWDTLLRAAASLGVVVGYQTAINHWIIYVKL